MAYSVGDKVKIVKIFPENSSGDSFKKVGLIGYISEVDKNDGSAVFRPERLRGNVSYEIYLKPKRNGRYLGWFDSEELEPELNYVVETSLADPFDSLIMPDYPFSLSSPFLGLGSADLCSAYESLTDKFGNWQYSTATSSAMPTATNKMKFQIGDEVKTKNEGFGVVVDANNPKYGYPYAVNVNKVHSGRGYSREDEPYFRSGRTFIYEEKELTLIKTKKTFMTKLNTMMKRILDPDIKKLIKGGLIDGDLQLTQEGRESLMAILFTEKKAELVKIAEENIKEAKEEK